MRGIATVPTYVVMQPTTLCNLDCAYCYLPFRAADRRMPVAVAAGGRRRRSTPWARPAGSRWSGTAASRWPPAGTHLAALIAPFDAGVEHHVQTNATLIDDAWCEFFAEHEIRVERQRRRARGRATATG